MLLQTVCYFQLGVWPCPLLSGDGETEHFSKKLRRGLESLKHCLQFTAECSGNGKCRQLFAFPACGIREAIISYCVEQLDLNTINYTLARCPTFGRRNMSPGLQ